MAGDSTVRNLPLGLFVCLFFFFQAEGGIRGAQEARGLGDVYKGQVSVDHDELSAAQDLERRLRRRWGRADGMTEPVCAYDDTSHADSALSDREAVPRTVDILRFGCPYLAKPVPYTHRRRPTTSPV